MATQDNVVVRLKQDELERSRKGDKIGRDKIKFIRAGVQNIEIDNKRLITEAEFIAFLGTFKKQTVEEIKVATEANRLDILENLKLQLEIIEGYMPEQLEEADIRQIVADLITSLSIENAKQKGRLMKPLMEQVKGKADGKLVAQIVDELLA